VTKLKVRTKTVVNTKNPLEVDENPALLHLNKLSAQCGLKIKPRRQEQEIKQPKYLSLRMIRHMLNRKNIHPCEPPLLARGRYFVVANNKHGLKILVTLHARSGVILKRRIIGNKPYNLFELALNA
jgi:hypothetical protein